MRQTTGTRKSPGEKLFKDIKRATRKQYSSEEKIRIVLDGPCFSTSIGPAYTRQGPQAQWFQRESRAALRAGQILHLRVITLRVKKTGAFELVVSRPLQHPALLQYRTKRGIDHDVVRAYLSEIDFKAPHSAGKCFFLWLPLGRWF